MAEADSSKLQFEEAVSTLLEYGFPKALIKRTLKDILKVYAGPEAWPLIKENGYEVVIERLVSDDAVQKRKSQRRDQYGLDKEKKQCNQDSDAGNARGLPESKMLSSSSLLVTLDLENVDIQSHQKNSWTRNGAFPLPVWFKKALNGSKKEVQQKFSNLHVLLERMDKGCFGQGLSVNNCSVNAPEVMAVKNEKFDCIEEKIDVCFSKPNVIKKEGHTQDLSNQRPVSATIQKTSNALSQHLNNPVISQTCDVGTGCLQQESNLKIQKFADDLRINHAEICSQQQSSLPMPQTGKLVDVVHSQHDVCSVGLNAADIKHYKRKDLSAGKDAKQRKRNFTDQQTYESVTAAQPITPRTQSTGERTNYLQSTLYATERLDIARMSACKLTRRRDGGSNPMFSRLQKLKQAGTGASVQSNLQEISDRKASEDGVAVLDSNADEETRSQESPKLPPGFWEPSDEETRSQESPKVPPGFWEPSVKASATCVAGIYKAASADPVPSPDSPKLPPGFWEPCGALQDSTVSGEIENQNPIASDDSPLLPPGFSEPYDADSSQESPRLPPGFWEPSDSVPTYYDQHFKLCKSEERTQRPCSPDLPPGFWESSGNRKVCRSPLKESRKDRAKDSQEEIWCSEDSVKCKGTPPNQVFIANIPEGVDGIEQKLYNLVREVLEGFKSVPISATLPRKIQVREDHAFVEFDCEAMVGIFIDAYLANVSVLRINGEQLLASRNMHLMKSDIQLRLAIASRLKDKVLNPCNVFYLGNVPSEWQNEERLFSHIASMLRGDAKSSLISETLFIYTIPRFSDVYVYIPSSILADTFFLRCLSDKEHLEEISASIFVCRNSAFLPRASKLCLGSE